MNSNPNWVQNLKFSDMGIINCCGKHYYDVKSKIIPDHSIKFV